MTYHHPVMRLAFIFFLFLTAVTVRAENPVFLGLRKAAALTQPIPERTAKEAIDAATLHLSPFLRKYGENFCCATVAGSSLWTEVKGLHFSLLTLDALSEADRANGIQQRILIHVDAAAYRRQGKDSLWGPWQSGLPLGLPPTVRVEQRSGQWTASSFASTYLRPVNDRPLVIPSKILPSKAASAEPQRIPPARSPANTLPQASTRRAEAPVPPSRPPQTPSADKITRSFVHGLRPLLVASGLGLALALVIFGLRRLKPDPPCTRRPSPTPPPLPAEVEKSDAYDFRGISTKTLLNSPTEHRFLDTLETLLPSGISISCKVRLADLFHLAHVPGFQSRFNRISCKHLDFVLTERSTSRILAAIELDDASHQRPDRIERDDFLNALFRHTLVPLIRVPVTGMNDLQALEGALHQACVPVAKSSAV